MFSYIHLLTWIAALSLKSLQNIAVASWSPSYIVSFLPPTLPVSMFHPPLSFIQSSHADLHKNFLWIVSFPRPEMYQQSSHTFEIKSKVFQSQRPCLIFLPARFPHVQDLKFHPFPPALVQPQSSASSSMSILASVSLVLSLCLEPSSSSSIMSAQPSSQFSEGPKQTPH